MIAKFSLPPSFAEVAMPSTAWETARILISVLSQRIFPGFRLVVLSALIAIALYGAAARAQTSDTPAKSADEVARELANPNTPLASLTFKNQLRWYTGDLPEADDQFNYTLLFQPVFPLTQEPTSSGGSANIFFRPAFPIVFDQPTFDAGKGNFDGVTALGDMGFDLAYGVTEKSGLLWAVGMVGTVPTATDDDIAGDQLRLGPEALFAKFEDWGLYGIFPSHQWDVAGDNDNYSTSQLQAFLTFLPGGGWSVGSTPIMNYDWEAEEWTIPLNLTISKTTRIGTMPLKLALEVNYYVEQPDVFGPQWMIGFNITPVVKNVFNEWLH